MRAPCAQAVAAAWPRVVRLLVAKPPALVGVLAQPKVALALLANVSHGLFGGSSPPTDDDVECFVSALAVSPQDQGVG
eukprot:COSAG01_NODE_7770_length_3065_cov_1.949427_2_plen_78_part_00